MNLALRRIGSKGTKGFTLIELLVVIAIIGLLSAVILAALNTARLKGNDAAIKADLDVIRTQGTNYYDTNGAYSVGITANVNGKTPNGTNCGTLATGSTFFTGDSTVVAAISGADKNSPGGLGGSPPTNVVCQFDAGASPTSPLPAGTTNGQVKFWTVYVPLNNNSGTDSQGNPNTGWCVDSSGNSRPDQVPTAGNIQCL